jgi:hypothetical protein
VDRTSIEEDEDRPGKGEHREHPSSREEARPPKADRQQGLADDRQQEAKPEQRLHIGQDLGAHRRGDELDREEGVEDAPGERGPDPYPADAGEWSIRGRDGATGERRGRQRYKRLTSAGRVGLGG